MEFLFDDCSVFLMIWFCDLGYCVFLQVKMVCWSLVQVVLKNIKNGMFLYILIVVVNLQLLKIDERDYCSSNYRDWGGDVDMEKNG